MDFQAVKDTLEKAAVDILPTTTLAALPSKFYDNFIIKGIRIERIEPGRVICSMRVPPRLLVGFPSILLLRIPSSCDVHVLPSNRPSSCWVDNGNFLHGGATASLVDIVGSSAFLSAGCPTSGVSMEINISYLDAAYVDEEIEIEAKVLRAGKAVGVVVVELRNKQSGKIIAHGRHTKYLAVSSKL